jgi:hypothetical protein
LKIVLAVSHHEVWVRAEIEMGNARMVKEIKIKLFEDLGNQGKRDETETKAEDTALTQPEPRSHCVWAKSNLCEHDKREHG